MHWIYPLFLEAIESQKNKPLSESLNDKFYILIHNWIAQVKY